MSAGFGLFVVVPRTMKVFYFRSDRDFISIYLPLSFHVRRRRCCRRRRRATTHYIIGYLLVVSFATRNSQFACPSFIWERDKWYVCFICHLSIKYRLDASNIWTYTHTHRAHRTEARGTMRMKLQRRPKRESLIVNKNTRKINNKSYQMLEGSESSTR